ncbi:unnamed protein product [Nezara viridula]|uniref:Uncharacterized protein n=1 Tax=Nezara viridula TaxID=85310 RepID=A0A9P0EBU5_NEZVI|nr:unnamed protein product [Nezara viridula]
MEAVTCRSWGINLGPSWPTCLPWTIDSLTVTKSGGGPDQEIVDAFRQRRLLTYSRKTTWLHRSDLRRPPSSSLSYPGHGSEDVRSPGSGGTPGPLSQAPQLDHSDPVHLNSPDSNPRIGYNYIRSKSLSLWARWLDCFEQLHPLSDDRVCSPTLIWPEWKLEQPYTSMI